MDAVYFCAGDRGALAQGRRARVLVATSREMGLLAGAGVRLDVVAGSGVDPGERFPVAGIDPGPGAVVRTEGSRGGTYVTADGGSGRWEPAPVPPARPGVVQSGRGAPRSAPRSRAASEYRYRRGSRDLVATRFAARAMEPEIRSRHANPSIASPAPGPRSRLRSRCRRGYWPYRRPRARPHRWRALPVVRRGPMRRSAAALATSP